MKMFLRIFALFIVQLAHCQESNEISGVVLLDSIAIQGADVQLKTTTFSASSDGDGKFSLKNIPDGNYVLQVNYIGTKPFKKNILVQKNSLQLEINLENDANAIDEIVVSGTMKPVSRMESPVPVEVYKPAFFKKNPTANIFEALQNVNGVRPQLNCNICNTGDIHINGLEGPYTLVMIDGMPIVSGLSTVYGLSGIPNSLIERVEIVKGPASSLYGSEAVGGLINIITKNPSNAPRFSADAFSNSWGEANVDLGFRGNIGEKSSVLLGVNYFHYSDPTDNNNDNFTDVTLQHRISVFQKWNFGRKSNKLFSLAGRYFYEDRWGGEMNWNKSFRGGDEVYGESIYTKRYEFLGAYELPLEEHFLFSFSFTDHDQNSVYGDVPFLARQKIAFGQLVWDKKIGRHDLLAGTALRYNYYDDSTPATETTDETWLPGIFVQDEISLNEKNSVLLGARFDHNSTHGGIFTPRFAYKFKATENDIIRLNAGTGFRVVNLFTEDHAALTGSRDVVIQEELKPEKSYNANINYLKKIYTENGNFIGIETSAWYTYFTNSIIPDYDSNPNQIIYKNLDGSAVTTGISTNIDMVFQNGLKVILGGTFMDVSKKENGERTRQILTENWSGTWAISYRIPKFFIDIDYTGNIYGPMRLPLLGELDPRREYSPVWSIQNIQFSYNKIKNVEIYLGVKNLLNWTPNRGNPFLIARANDPFDKEVEFGPNGNVVPTPQNPYALTFDPSYVFAPNQGIRSFAGVRFTLK